MKTEKISYNNRSEHTIKTNDVLHFQTYDEMMAEYRSSETFNMQCWAPDNGASFKSIGAASRWLKKLVRKHGWPNSCVWIIQPRQVFGKPLSVEIYLAN